jgi:hypothetical protein
MRAQLYPIGRDGIGPNEESERARERERERERAEGTIGSFSFSARKRSTNLMRSEFIGRCFMSDTILSPARGQLHCSVSHRLGTALDSDSAPMQVNSHNFLL